MLTDDQASKLFALTFAYDEAVFAMRIDMMSIHGQSPKYWKRVQVAFDALQAYLAEVRLGRCPNGMEHQNCNHNDCTCPCHTGKPWQDIHGDWHTI